MQESTSPIAQWTGGKDFARGTNFSCMATSGAGHVVVGSKDGKIRLYSSSTLTQASDCTSSTTQNSGMNCYICHMASMHKTGHHS